MPEKDYTYKEQLFLEIAKSKYGAPTLGVMSLILVPAAAGTLALLLGWTSGMDKAIGKKKLTGQQKLLVILSPPLAALYLDEQEKKQLERELRTSALTPVDVAVAPLHYWWKKITGEKEK